MTLIDQIVDGRTDLVFEHVAAGHPASATDSDGVSLIRWCAYYGDVSAIRFLLTNGESLASLGANFDLNGASFHGHWQLCLFLIESGARVNTPLEPTGESPLHAALSSPISTAVEHVVRVLLAHGADPNHVTQPGVATGNFMRDARTRAETPLHRAAAFGSEPVIRLLLGAGAKVDAKDMNGDSPLTWASWYRRPDSVLQLLCYGGFSIQPNRRPLAESLAGKPHV